MSSTKIILAIALGVILAEIIAITVLGVRNRELEAQLKTKQGGKNHHAA